MRKIQTAADKFCALEGRVRRHAGWLLPAALALVFCSSLAVIGVGDVNANSAGADSAAPQASITGEWFADFSRKNPAEVQFTIIRRSERGGRHSSGGGIGLGELQGLTREQAFGARTEVSFRLVREAGTFQCEGFFKEGRGAGHWTLTLSPEFVSTMRARGYDNLTEEQLFTAAVTDVRVKTLDELKAAGYDRLSFDELVEATIFKVTADFIREMKSAGFDNLTLKQLVEARIFEVDGQYAKEVEAMGFGRQPLSKLVNMRVHDITPEFISKMRSMGFENLSLDELGDLSIHHVTPEFVNGIKAEGFAPISARQAVELKIFGVDRDFIRRVRAKGFSDVTLKQLVELRIHGVIK